MCSLAAADVIESPDASSVDQLMERAAELGRIAGLSLQPHFATAAAAAAVDIERARTLIEEAERAMAVTDESWGRVETLRVRADVERRSGAVSAAIGTLHDALDLAVRQGAGLLGGRAIDDLRVIAPDDQRLRLADGLTFPVDRPVGLHPTG
jgi:hypothetical protein